jgi:soluble lytic murein transglycosylase-like protein
MVFHKRRLSLFCAAVVSFSVVAKGAVIKDCDIIRQAKAFGAIDPQLVLAVSKIESSNNSSAIGRQDPRNMHYGMMQLKLGTARMLGFRGHHRELLQWKPNLKLGIGYLNEKLRKYRSIKAAAAAYNAGAAYSCRKGRSCRKGGFVNQGYVDRVMAQYRRHSKLQCLRDPV